MNSVQALTQKPPRKSRWKKREFRRTGARQPHPYRLINWPFLHELRGAPAEYKARLDFAIERGWLWKHESETYVKFTPAGSELFA